MVQTQLASMFLGSPTAFDQEERLRGVSSQLNATIHILDNQSNQGVILDYITAKHIIEDNHKKSLEDNLETFNFITFANMDYSEHLENRNRLIIPDEDGSMIEFVIFESAKYLDSDGRKMQVYSHASYLELKKASVLYPESYKGTASQHAGRTLDDTGWQVGKVEVKGNKTLSRDKHTDPFKFMKHIAKEYDAELKFRVEHNGNKVTGRYVDLLERVGEWRGREVEFGKDLDSIRRTEEQDIATALLGIGPEDDNDNRLEVLVEDDDALKRWGRVDSNGKLHHLIEAYEIDSTRDDMTNTEARQYTRTALDKRINTQVKYEVKIVDLENVPGMESKKIRFGDTIKIKDTGFNPPLLVEARVFEQTRSIKSRAKKDIKLGDFIEYTEEEVNAIWIMLQREIKKKIDVEKLEEYAEMKRIESDTPPEIKDGENPIWVDTSKTPKVSNVVIGGEWQKMTPTTPAEVDAYNKQQVDDRDEYMYGYSKEYAEQEAKDKAEQALKDAKAFSKNADNISDGVIDVGAIPLRTSATGARLEWDGVNGLVQYNSGGKEVSWLDLDANAHFANAFLSGRIEALEGYFGKDGTIRITEDGGVEIVRPDGAVSSENGLTKNGYTVIGNDPHFMTAGKNSGNFTFNAFVPGGIDRPTSSHIYSGVKGTLDGRGIEEAELGYDDVRDEMTAVAFQKYHFVHSSRYLVFRFYKYGGAKYSVHVMEGTSTDIDNDRLYFEMFETDVKKRTDLIIDLGVPDFKVRTVTFKIGWTKSWGDRGESMRFIMENVYLSDFE